MYILRKFSSELVFVEKKYRNGLPARKESNKKLEVNEIFVFFFRRKHFSENTQLLRTMIYSRSKEVDTRNRSPQPIINHSSQPSINLVKKSKIALQKSKI